MSHDVVAKESFKRLRTKERLQAEWDNEEFQDYQAAKAKGKAAGKANKDPADPSAVRKKVVAIETWLIEKTAKLEAAIITLKQEEIYLK